MAQRGILTIEDQIREAEEQNTRLKNRLNNQACRILKSLTLMKCLRTPMKFNPIKGGGRGQNLFIAWGRLAPPPLEKGLRELV